MQATKFRLGDGGLLALFTITSFVASGLVFLVQPMIGKMVLPLYGGSPSVWNICLVFFQTMLLLGYAYTHGTWTLFKQRQPVVHVGLLLVPLLLLPLTLPDWAAAPQSASAALWLLLVLLVSVGVPFLMVCTSSPLLQAWFSSTNHKRAHDPYFLYAAGNAGSLIALLSYPFVVEPLLATQGQSLLWSGGYVLLVFLVAACALTTRLRRAGADDSARSTDGAVMVDTPTEAGDVAEVESLTWRRRLWWVLLAAIPSSLLLGVTTFVTTDIAAVPLLWVIPLALYLVTFILAFGQRRRGSALVIGPLLLTTALGALLTASTPVLNWELLTAAMQIALFTLIAYACHSVLADDRPHAAQLTQFYLLLAIGGALGGMFNSLIAPVIFESAIEYRLTLALAFGVLAVGLYAKVSGSYLTKRHLKPALLSSLPVIAVAIFATVNLGLDGVQLAIIVAGSSLIVLVATPRIAAVATAMVVLATVFLPGQPLLQSRSFFGVHTVKAVGTTHQLVHGNTMHGIQDFAPGRELEPLSYYSRPGPAGDVFRVYGDEVEDWAAVGLGTGTLSTYAEPEDDVTFYEIDDEVVKIARDPQYFTYLTKAKTPIDVALGDARIELAEAPDDSLDLIVLDAFSSDAVPAHLLTREAFALYGSKLRPDGKILVHISNRHLDLEPVMASVAAANDMAALVRRHDESFIPGATPSTWVTVAEQAQELEPLKDEAGWVELRSQSGTLWTDSYSNVVRILDFG